ncbi:VanZ family protein [Paraferrimonas haliotis]|uniref:Teicoplanin resistance protein VanZ n=1 Tax=Paraferrimonas haliotis TaxID=2013866 RepID=A0AA37TN25_9GAMM|nr:VanZ family protein [Paraferrimonas haliotis]GLS82778.1 teicoplanin resistance protein VanZ [Paraferrimonas haliotis]
MIYHPRVYQTALVLAFLSISFLVFSKPNYPELDINHFDKYGHIGAFWLLSWLTYASFHWRWPALVGAMASYAVFIEVIQSKLPYRSAEVADFIADMFGVVLFYASLWLYRRVRQA